MNQAAGGARLDMQPILQNIKTEAFRVIQNGRTLIIEAHQVFSGPRVLPYHVFIVNAADKSLPGRVDDRPIDIPPGHAYFIRADRKAESDLDALLGKPAYFVALLPVDGMPAPWASAPERPFELHPVAFELLRYLASPPDREGATQSVRTATEALLLRHLFSGLDADPMRPTSAAHDWAAKIERAVSLIRQEYRTELPTAVLAEAAAMSERHFITRFREYTGKTPHHFLTDYRVMQARQLLAISDAPLIDVALECGFGSYARFFEAFKAAAGMSPSAYRDSLAGRE